ncbi:MAG: hypothetical protein V3V02_04475 [Rhizobiaceae bacterium]
MGDETDNIEYDPDLRIATHIESRLAVEFLDYGLYVQEQDVNFRLLWKGRNITFQTHHNNGYSRLRDKNPHLSGQEISILEDKLNETNFSLQELSDGRRRFIRSTPKFPEIFLKVWLRVVSEINPSARCSVQVSTMFHLSDSEQIMQAKAPLKLL